MLTPEKIAKLEHDLDIIDASMRVLFDAKNYAEWLDLFLMSQTILFNLLESTGDEKYCETMNRLMNQFELLVKEKCRDSDIETRETWKILHLKTINIIERMRR